MIEPTMAADIVRRYLDALERFDLEAAADCFTDDVFYSHPPYAGDAGALRVESKGRYALIRLFQGRGPRSVSHAIRSCAVAGSTAFVEGWFSRGPEDEARGSFVSVVELADDGRISSYAAYASVPEVGYALSVSE